MTTVRALACGVLFSSACLISPVVRFGEGKTAKQAQRDTMAEFGPARLASGEKWKGEIVNKRVRVWADDQYRAQNIHWQETFTESLELTNVVFEQLVGVHLTPDFSVWDRDVPGATLTDSIAALQEVDPGEDVFAVIGLTSSLPLVSSTFEQLGLAMIGGRHIMLRGYADLEERKLYANAFPDLRPEERELALEHLRHHKSAVVLLHELGHVLGVDHETDSATIMNASYSNRATAFSTAARQVMVASVDARVQRPQTGPTALQASALSVQPQQKPAPPAVAKPTTHHAPITIRVTRKRETIVDGKRLDSAALTQLLNAAYAEDPSTKIIISEDRHVPTGVVGDLIDQLSAIGFTKAEFAWSGK
jgi:biopolymer transport protein ExbD